MMEDFNKPNILYIDENLRIFPPRKKRTFGSSKIKEEVIIDKNLIELHFNKCIRGYFIYFLRCPIENIVRYIGLTKDPKERYRGHKKDKNKNNPYKERWVEKLKQKNLVPIFEIIERNLFLEEAKNKEINYISEYRNKIGRKLTNIADGGNVPPRLCGDLATAKRPEVRAKISAAKSKEKHHMWGKHVPTQTKLLVSYGVDQYSRSGELLKKYEGLFLAEQETGIEKVNISFCCKGKVKSAGGFVWRLDGEPFNKFETELIDLKKKVIQYDLNGNIVAKFDGINEARFATKIDNIGYCCNGKRNKAGGFVWRFEEDSFDKFDCKNFKGGKQIDQYSLDDQFINSFRSASEAARQMSGTTSTICEVAGKVNRTAFGFKWRWANE